MILFNQMGLSPGVLRAVEDLGYEIHTPVQEQTIHELMEQSRDIVASAQTGTVKTPAFGLPEVSQIDCSTPLTSVQVR
mgnify:CR=1 FL=1